MKLTREQVEALTDTELNRAMIWCYPSTGEFWSDPETGTNYSWDKYELEQLHYLDDYNLTMPLAVDNEIQLLTGQGHSGWHVAKKQYYDYDGPISNLATGDLNPLRAICEVLFMIAMEREA